MKKEFMLKLCDVSEHPNFEVNQTMRVLSVNRSTGEILVLAREYGDATHFIKSLETLPKDKKPTFIEIDTALKTTWNEK